MAPSSVFTHFAVYLTTDPQRLPIRVLHTQRHIASSFSHQYRLFTLNSFGSCLLLLPCLPQNLRTPFPLSSSCLPSSLSYLRFFLTHFPSSGSYLRLLPCLPSLLPYPFPIIQLVLMSSSLSSLHFFPTHFSPSSK